MCKIEQNIIGDKMFDGFKLIWNYRKVLFSTVINDIRAKYVSSLLGMIWSVIYPILFLSIYSVIYVNVYKVQLEGITSWEYVIILFCGLIPWFGFSESIMLSTNSIVSNASLLKNTLFPVDILPVKAVFTSVFTQLISILLLVISLACNGKLGVNIFFVIPAFVIQIFFMIGLGWILSSLNVIVRDISQFMPILLLLILTISPIAYTPDMMPEGLRSILTLNPLSYIISIYRGAIIGSYSKIICDICISLSISIVVFIVGYNIFRRLKVVFSDYV